MQLRDEMRDRFRDATVVATVAIEHVGRSAIARARGSARTARTRG